MKEVVLVLPLTEHRVRDKKREKDIVCDPLQLIKFEHHRTSRQRRHSYIRDFVSHHRSREESLNPTSVTSRSARFVERLHKEAWLGTERLHANETADSSQSLKIVLVTFGRRFSLMFVLDCPHIMKADQVL